MCCLKHEQEVYEEKIARLPNIGAIVKTPDGKGTVESVSVLREIIGVKIEKDEETIRRTYKFEDIKIIKNATKKDDDTAGTEELKQLEEGFKNTEDII
jgi:cell fate regulator YaaT (PSP1 superfamily)